jgi:predicted Zn-dependent protease
VEDVGRRLVAAIPPELRHSEFRYTFQVVNVREINAFALPGGPMFVNRGMIEAARTEGEVAGVMAHELSHVVLRHGTAQANKAQKYQIGEVAGAVLGAIIGGRVANTSGRRTSRGRTSWRAPATTRATWRISSRPSNRPAAQADRSG